MRAFRDPPAEGERDVMAEILERLTAIEKVLQTGGENIEYTAPVNEYTETERVTEEAEKVAEAEEVTEDETGEKEDDE